MCTILGRAIQYGCNHTSIHITHRHETKNQNQLDKTRKINDDQQIHHKGLVIF